MGIVLSFAENQGLGELQAFVAFGGSRAGHFILRFVGTCVVFYPFFLCRTIGAGDIKLMGVIAGFLGVWDSVFVIGLGMIFAAAAASYRMIKQVPAGAGRKVCGGDRNERTAYGISGIF